MRHDLKINGRLAMKTLLGITVFSFVLWMNPAVATDVCNCKGYSGPGGICYDGPGGPAYDGPGGPAYSGPGVRIESA